MSVPSRETNELYKELKWVSLAEDEPNYIQKIKSKGVFGVLVPLGCITTVGVLLRGLYFLLKKDSKKQQQFMRYRVLAQGVTLGLATIGVISFKPS